MKSQPANYPFILETLPIFRTLLEQSKEQGAAFQIHMVEYSGGGEGNFQCLLGQRLSAHQRRDRWRHSIACYSIVRQEKLYRCMHWNRALVNMPPAQARAMLLFMHYVYARLLKAEEHRHNAYRTMVTLFRKQSARFWG